MNKYNYLIEKINQACFIKEPFEHIEIKNFLNQKDLNMIVNEKQIHFTKMKNHDDLYKTLINKKWDIINLHTDGILQNNNNDVNLFSGSSAAYILSISGAKKLANSYAIHNIDVYSSMNNKFLKYKNYVLCNNNGELCV